MKFFKFKIFKHEFHKQKHIQRIYYQPCYYYKYFGISLTNLQLFHFTDT